MKKLPMMPIPIPDVGVASETTLLRARLMGMGFHDLQELQALRIAFGVQGRNQPGMEIASMRLGQEIDLALSRRLEGFINNAHRANEEGEFSAE